MSSYKNANGNGASQLRQAEVRTLSHVFGARLENKAPASPRIGLVFIAVVNPGKRGRECRWRLRALL